MDAGAGGGTLLRKVGLREHRVQNPERAEARREEILVAAAKVFACKGYAAATMEHVAAECGVTKGVLYYHFPSKEALYVESMCATSEAAIARLERIIARGGPPADTLRAAVADFVEPSLHSLNHYVVVLGRVHSISAASRRRLGGLLRQYTRLFRGIVEEGLAQGVFAKRDPVVMMATAVSAAYVTFWFDPGGSPEPREIARQVADQVMTGILAPA